MKIGNTAFDLADLRVEQERAAGIRRAQAAISEPGAIHCVACGQEIEQQRRKALPSARRCLECQWRLERQQQRRA